MSADATVRTLIDAVAARIIASADELTALDQAIGDGDHGVNMKRGFEAILAERDAIAALPLPQALQKAGMTLVMKVGGASGPLYGTLFMQLGKSLPENADHAALAKAVGEAIAAVKARGKSDTGQKTMLDVLVPVHAALERGDAPAALAQVADEAAAATVPMKATRGRASFLGDRSIGHMDPGARSSAIIVRAVAEAAGA
jgi:phosphoenolpyruvate---glycerone phosphotransferase subunit DhaL